jgi:EAL domain-containing protein (putative c-di-GMP-specific phosphodiesterase class I)
MEGQSQYHIYKDHESKKKPANIILEQDLRQAIHNDELTILYQPKVDLIHRNAIGVEALSRWYSPVHGNVPPDIFIAVAESSDLIQPQTKWLFNNALRQYSACGIDKYTGMSLSLNLSPNLLQNDDITHIINSSLNMWDINPQNIILEITESAIMVNPEKCLKILTSIHDSGIRLSIDDFGTGYSSLAYLKKLPVDELKIDRSFVMNMENNKGDEKIVHSIIELAHNFDLVVVAEGIESQHALDMLTHYGCDFAQGFFIAKPMPGDDLLKWIENYNSHNKEKSEYNNI